MELPQHLRTLAQVSGEVIINAGESPTVESLLNALEQRYPMLRGTIRDHTTHKRRPYVRYFACGHDISFADPDALLPPAIANGSEPFLVVGAIAGG